MTGFLAEQWWVFELTSNLRLHLALTLLGGAAALLGLRAFAMAQLALGAAAVNLVAIAFVLAPSSPTPPSAEVGAASLEVTFFNTKIVHADMDRTIEVLEARDDDVVILSGGTPQWVERLRMSDLDLEVVLGPHTHDRLELIALTADPGAEVAVHQLGEERRDVFVEVTAQLDGQQVHVLGTHVVSPLTPERAGRRDAMLEWVPGWVAAVDGPAVVVGDLNATPWSPTFRGVLDRAGLVDSQRGHGLQPSYPASLRWLGITIDHVLHTPDLTAVDRELGPSLGSDHRMVHVTLAPARLDE